MMMNLVTAALAAAAPVPSTQPAPMGHAQHQQAGHGAEHKGMDCCKDCCKDMAAKHEGHDNHSGQSGS